MADIAPILADLKDRKMRDKDVIGIEQIDGGAYIVFRHDGAEGVVKPDWGNPKNAYDTIDGIVTRHYGVEAPRREVFTSPTVRVLLTYGNVDYWGNYWSNGMNTDPNIAKVEAYVEAANRMLMDKIASVKKTLPKN